MPGVDEQARSPIQTIQFVCEWEGLSAKERTLVDADIVKKHSHEAAKKVIEFFEERLSFAPPLSKSIQSDLVRESPDEGKWSRKKRAKKTPNDIIVEQ